MNVFRRIRRFIFGPGEVVVYHRPPSAKDRT